MQVARRIASFDVARGAAMLFVCLSHCAMSYFDFWSPSRPPAALESLGQTATVISFVATPTFLLLSGIVLGYFWRVNPGSFPGLKRKLVDRGLFLVIVGHFLQVIPAAVQLGGWQVALRFSYVTDAIGAAIIIGPNCVTATRARSRVILGVALLALSWAANCLWDPGAPAAVTLSRYIFGTPVLDSFPGFPIIPWLAIYLLGTALGEVIGSLGDVAEAEPLLLRVGSGALAIGIALSIARKLVRIHYPDFFAAHDVLAVFLGPTRKFPPGPTYLLLFIGAGLVLIAAAFALSRSTWAQPITRPLASLGRASFLVFVLQGYVYYFTLPSLAVHLPLYWPIYYVVSLGLFLSAAALWDSVRGNRYLTVGLWRAVSMMRQPRSFIAERP